MKTGSVVFMQSC